MWPAQRVYEEATNNTEAAAEIFESEGEPEGVVTDCASLGGEISLGRGIRNKVHPTLRG